MTDSTLFVASNKNLIEENKDDSLILIEGGALKVRKENWTMSEEAKREIADLMRNSGI